MEITELKEALFNNSRVSSALVAATKKMLQLKIRIFLRYNKLKNRIFIGCSIDIFE